MPLSPRFYEMMQRPNAVWHNFWSICLTTSSNLAITQACKVGRIPSCTILIAPSHALTARVGFLSSLLHRHWYPVVFFRKCHWSIHGLKKAWQKDLRGCLGCLDGRFSRCTLTQPLRTCNLYLFFFAIKMSSPSSFTWCWFLLHLSVALGIPYGCSLAMGKRCKLGGKSHSEIDARLPQMSWAINGLLLLCNHGDDYNSKLHPMGNMCRPV